MPSLFKLDWTPTLAFGSITPWTNFAASDVRAYIGAEKSVGFDKSKCLPTATFFLSSLFSCNNCTRVCLRSPHPPFVILDLILIHAQRFTASRWYPELVPWFDAMLFFPSVITMTRVYPRASIIDARGCSHVHYRKSGAPTFPQSTQVTPIPPTTDP